MSSREQQQLRYALPRTLAPMAALLMLIWSLLPHSGEVPTLEYQENTYFAEADVGNGAIRFSAQARHWSHALQVHNLAHEAYHVADFRDDGALNGSVAVATLDHEPRAASLVSSERVYQSRTADWEGERQAVRFACGIAYLSLWCDE